MVKDTRERMIETTARLLQHRGYYGTPLSLILEESGAPRGSLYFHFPGGKDQLVVEATKRTIAEATDALHQALAEMPGPAQAVRAYFTAAANLLRETQYTFGCPVAPVILDAAGGVQELADLCKAAFEEWVSILEGAFIEAGIAKKKAAALALLVDSSLEGLLLISRAYRNTEAFLTVAAELEAIIKVATPPRRRQRTNRVA